MTNSNCRGNPYDASDFCALGISPTSDEQRGGRKQDRIKADCFWSAGVGAKLIANSKARPPLRERGDALEFRIEGPTFGEGYAVVYAFSINFFTAACAAARRAMGTR